MMSLWPHRIEQRSTETLLVLAQEAFYREKEEWATRQAKLYRYAERPTIKAIQIKVAEEAGLSLHEFLYCGSAHQYSWPRQKAMWLCRQELLPSGQNRWSYPAIGRAFNCDHTTVMHGVKAYEKRMKDAADYLDA